MVSPVSGCIYERRLIEKYITENGTDPMNGEKLNAAELVDIKSKLFFSVLESHLWTFYGQQDYCSSFLQVDYRSYKYE